MSHKTISLAEGIYNTIMHPRLYNLLCNSEAERVATADDWRGLRHLEMYLTTIAGQHLLFYQHHRWQEHRCYLLTDEFAKVLGFGDLKTLKDLLPIRRSLRFVSIKRLREVIWKYAHRNVGLKPCRAMHRQKV